MKINSVLSPRIVVAASAAILALSTFAQAGPPLICHAIDIGQAKSLPWTSDASLSSLKPYPGLVQGTLAILAPSTPVLVRMETLRRATLYARQDPQAAKELLTRLYNRATTAESAGHVDALAWFDAGYLVECYRQWLGKNLPHMTDGLRMDPNPASGLDGFAWVTKAIALRGQDPEMEFAAALIALGGSGSGQEAHARKAIAGAKNDPLLAVNLSSHFIGPRDETIAEMFTKVTSAKN